MFKVNRARPGNAQANSRSHDRFDKAALFYASQVGDINAVKALLKTDFRPEFPQYQGRTQRVECSSGTSICYSGSQNVPDIEPTIWALAKGGASPLEKWRGRTAPFLALSNAQLYCITQGFLNTASGARRYFDNGSNGNSYLELEKLLRTMECVDRYFAGYGFAQPHGATGLPKDIAEEILRLEEESNEYWKSETSHQTKIRRKYEESQAQHELWQQQQAEQTAQKINDSTTIHETQLHQNMQMSSRQQSAIVQKNAIAGLSLQRQHHLELDFQQQSGQQKLNKVAFQQAQNRVAQSAQTQKLATQEKQNHLRKEKEFREVLYAKRMQAIKASEERQKLQAKKAGHKEDLSS
ncbi:hypothetical protein GGR57DRAFT_506024 [Xylariaceae sp. FL1272]|nr:hypothetical protein GGR57DRAFT_506024 [Xylariaceae sp. FL1272]